MFGSRSNFLSLLALGISTITLFIQSGPHVSSAFAPGDVEAAVAAPNIFNYQGILRKPDGALVTGVYTMTFALYDVVAGGSSLHAETKTNVAVRDGIFNVLIGDPIPVPTSVITTATIYLGIKVGNEGEMQPRQRIYAVPRALRADKADSIAGGPYWTKADGSLDIDGSLIVRGNSMNGGNATIGLFAAAVPNQPFYLQNLGGTLRVLTDPNGTRELITMNSSKTTIASNELNLATKPGRHHQLQQTNQSL